MTAIQHTETIVYYDGVQVFVGQDAVGGQFVGTMISTDNYGDRYLVVSVTPEPLRQFYAGKLDLRTLLLESSADGWHTALVDDDFEGPVSLELQQDTLLDMDYLPEAGFYLREAPSMNPSDDSWNIASSPTNADAMRHQCFGQTNCWVVQHRWNLCSPARLGHLESRRNSYRLGNRRRPDLADCQAARGRPEG